MTSDEEEEEEKKRKKKEWKEERDTYLIAAVAATEKDESNLYQGLLGLSPPRPNNSSRASRSPSKSMSAVIAPVCV